MGWMDNAVINCKKQTCDGSTEYSFKRYEKTVDCLNRECGNATDYKLHAIIQPLDDVNESMRDVFGESVHGLIVAHYYPLKKQHIDQIDQGVYLQTSGAQFQINGFDADGACADRLLYQGQWWRVVKTSCVEGMCGGCEEYDWACRAILCLDHCQINDEQATQIEELMYAPE